MQAAPSLRVEALPAVTVPPSRKTGRSFAIFSSEASGRGPSSASTVTVSRPFGASIGTISSANSPASAAATARWWLRRREGVLVLAADPVALGDVLAGLAHRLGRDAQLGHPRVDEAPAQRRVVHRLLAARQAALGLADHPGRPAHRLDPAGEVEVALAELDRAGGGVDRLQARGAEAVDGRPGDAAGQAGEQRRHPRHVAVVLARLVGGAEVDVGDPLGVDAGALDHGADRRGRRGRRAARRRARRGRRPSACGSRRLRRPRASAGLNSGPGVRAYPWPVGFVLATVAMLAVPRRRPGRRRPLLPGQQRRPGRLEADPLARGRGPERDRRRPADARGAERDAPPPRRSRDRPRRSCATRSRRRSWSRCAAGTRSRPIARADGAGADRRLRLPRAAARRAAARGGLGGAGDEPPRGGPGGDRGGRDRAGARRPRPPRHPARPGRRRHRRPLAARLGARASRRRSRRSTAPRLERFLEKLVDTPVRGFVYEAAGQRRSPPSGAGRGDRARGRARPGASRSRSSGPIRATRATWAEAMLAAIDVCGELERWPCRDTGRRIDMSKLR